MRPIPAKLGRRMFFVHMWHSSGKLRKGLKRLLDKISLVLVIIGAINWLLVGLFQFDVVSWVFGGQEAILSRIVYSLVGIAGLWCVTLLFRDRNREVVHHHD